MGVWWRERGGSHAMAHGRLPLAFLLKVAIFCQVWIAECKGDGFVLSRCNQTLVQKATIGKRFNVSCTVKCPADMYQWFNDTDQLLSETGKVLTVSERVESAAAVGGQRYACRCDGGNTEPIQCHLIWVNPFVKFNASEKIVTLGSSVTFHCSAESYPPADNVTFFQLQHPLDNDIPPHHLTLVNTSVVYHVANASKRDGGEYECVVIVYESLDGVHLQSESRTDFIVYDPPRILSIQNFTLSSEPRGVEFAVLECEVENKEDGLEVWVNWITRTRDQKGCVEVGEHSIVFYLLLHNVTKEDVHPYTCQLFSNYSVDKAEDQKTAELLIADTDVCSGTPEQKPTSEGATSTPGEENCAVTGIIVSFIVGFIMSAATTTIWIIICVVAQKGRKNTDDVHPEKDETSAQGNDDKQYVNGDSLSDGQSAPDSSPKGSGRSTEGKKLINKG